MEKKKVISDESLHQLAVESAKQKAKMLTFGQWYSKEELLARKFSQYEVDVLTFEGELTSVYIKGFRRKRTRGAYKEPARKEIADRLKEIWDQEK